MDSKITKKRLSLMLSYDWVKIILTAVGIILVWAFIFSATSTKITQSQQFSVYSYVGNNTLSNDFYHSLQSAFKEENIFSFEVIETDSYDFSTVGDEANTVLSTRMGVGEGDVIFLSPGVDPDSAYTEEGSEEVKYSSTYAKTFVSSYYYTLFVFDQNEDGSFTEGSMFGQLETYLNGYYDGDWEEGVLNEEKVEKDFRARVKKNNDKRFKTTKQIEQGIEWNKERIIKYRDALIEMYGYLEKGYVKPEYTTIKDPYDTTIEVTHAYTLNICPDEAKANDLKKVVSYQTQYVDENGASQPKNTAANMQVGLFNFSDVENGFEYESLIYINYIIRNALTVE